MELPLVLKYIPMKYATN